MHHRAPAHDASGQFHGPVAQVGKLLRLVQAHGDFGQVILAGLFLGDVAQDALYGRSELLVVADHRIDLQHNLASVLAPEAGAHALQAATALQFVAKDALVVVGKPEVAHWTAQRLLVLKTKHPQGGGVGF